MNIPDLTKESIHLSTILNACGLVLPLLQIRRDLAFNYCEMNNFIGSLGTDHKLQHFIMLLVGSAAEGLDLDAIIDQDCQPLQFSSDNDYLIAVNNMIVYEHISQKKFIEATYPKFNHFIREPDNKYPGYAKLAVTRNVTHLLVCPDIRRGKYFLSNTMKEVLFQNDVSKGIFSKHLRVQGPAINTNFTPRDSILHSIYSKGQYPNLPENVRSRTPRVYQNGDFTYCLRGDTWPDEASEWTTRKRLSNWPPKELFNNIIKLGYSLVGVGSKDSSESEFQWRVCFTRAEQLMIKSFNETQMHCIVLLKLLKLNKLTELSRNNITSYSMKTVMFWCLEEKSNDYWKSSNLVCCVCFCLSKLQSFVQNGYLPNYFIRKRNQFILSEFTPAIQTETRQYLQSFLETPIESLYSLLSKYNIFRNNPQLSTVGQNILVKEWLRIRVQMAMNYHYCGMHLFWNLYNGYNTQDIFRRCNCAMQKLSSIHYQQPFIKLLQNCMGILQTILLTTEKEINEKMVDFDSESKYSNYLKLSVGADRTHTSLRIATCLLVMGEKKECINRIRSVTHYKHTYYAMQEYKDLVFKELCEVFVKDFLPTTNKYEIEEYERVIEQDLIYHNPYKTIKEFKRFNRGGRVVDAYRLFQLIWERCCFDVTFMSVEVVILPKPAALELYIDSSELKISFHPIIYGLLLEFLWNVKNDSIDAIKDKVIKKMIKYIPNMTEGQQSTGLNFITYCCALQKKYCSAAKYLIQSFKLNPVKRNVAYLYIKYIINLLRIILPDLIVKI